MKNTEPKNSLLKTISLMYLVCIAGYITFKIYVADFAEPEENSEPLTEEMFIDEMLTFVYLIAGYLFLKLLIFFIERRK